MDKNELDGNRSFADGEAVSESAALAEWQVEEVEKGIAEADRGEFASDEEVEELLKRWTIQE
jgi:predicted transcriptional regulator